MPVQINGRHEDPDPLAVWGNQVVGAQGGGRGKERFLQGCSVAVAHSCDRLQMPCISHTPLQVGE